jgi:hypothetical protein
VGAGAVPASFATQMAYATGALRHTGRGESGEEERRMGKLVLARMGALEEGFREVLLEVRQMRQEGSFPSEGSRSRSRERYREEERERERERERGRERGRHVRKEGHRGKDKDRKVEKGKKREKERDRKAKVRSEEEWVDEGAAVGQGEGDGGNVVRIASVGSVVERSSV